MLNQSPLMVATHTWKLSIIIGLLACMLGLVQPGYSHGAMTEPGLEKSLSQLVIEAELIFSGTVQKVEFGLSQGRTDSQGG